MAYVYRRGETILVGLDALSGDPITVSLVQSSLRIIGPGGVVGVIVGSFAVGTRPADIPNNVPAGWTLTIPAGVSIGFADGDYVMDAKLTLAGGTIEYADPLYITIQEPITL